jgi:hypothetical protein
MMSTKNESGRSPAPARLGSLDQFRGYTIAGMFVVNFIGSFYAAPYLLGHHLVFCSYADTIMPQFFFAVGFSMRLSWSRRSRDEGLAKAYFHAIQRSFALAIIAILWYKGSPFLPTGITFEWDSFKSIGLWGAVWKQLKVDWFQTLLHIAVASVWVLPVIRASMRLRLAYLVFSVVLHAVLSYWFYFAWNNGAPKGIDGGPLGFLTWSVPLLCGTLTYDSVQAYRNGETTASKVSQRMLVWSAVLCLIGWALSCGTRWYDVAPEQLALQPTKTPVLSSDPVLPPRDALSKYWNDLTSGQWDKVLAEAPFVSPPHARDPRDNDPHGRTVDNSSRYRPWNYWMMSQQVGSPSYLLFCSGISIAIYLVFFLVCDLWGWEIGLFRTLGVNALIGYFLHSIVEGTVKSFLPRDISRLGMWIGFGVYFLLCWMMLRSLEKKKIFLKL